MSTTLTDSYSQVLYNDGEQLTFGDLNLMQGNAFARAVEQLTMSLLPNINDKVATPGLLQDAELGYQMADSYPIPHAICPSVGYAAPIQGSGGNNQVLITRGTLLQKIAAADGSGSTLLAFTFDGTTTFTIANNADATHFRVDVIQMALATVAGTPTSRVIDVNPVKASLALATKTTHENTVVRAKVAGSGGNNITIALAKRSSGTGVTYSESGNAVTILYQDGVSTVANVEAALAASTLIEIATAGTAGNVLHDPADSFAATALAGGVDTLFVAETVNKTTKVQCTLSVKSYLTTGGSSFAQYPTLDAGCCAIAAVVVPPSYSGAAPFTSDDSNTLAVLHDQRLPLGVRAFTTFVQEMVAIGWSYGGGGSNYTLQAPVSAANIVAACKAGRQGRVISISAGMSQPSGGPFSHVWLGKLTVATSGANTVGDTVAPAFPGPTSLANGVFSQCDAHMSTFQGNHAPSVGPTVNCANGISGSLGPPLWSNGKRAPDGYFVADSAPPAPLEMACLQGVGASHLTNVGPVTFHVATGL